MKIFLLILVLISQNSISQNNVEIQNFAKEFFNWRVINQPVTGDDIPRVERPDKWIPDDSPVAIAAYREKYIEFSSKLKNLPRSGWSKSDSVDYLLLHSAVERVNWELNILKLPNRNPDFYVHQTLGSVYELLLIHSPINRKRAENIILRLNSFNKTIRHAKTNLNELVNSFDDIALGSLKDIKSRLYKMRDALNKLFPVDLNAQLNSAVEHAVIALEDYIKWLEKEKPNMQTTFNVGREGYEYFLKNIALIPYSPEELLIMGKQEWNRSVSFDIYEKQRNKILQELKIFSSAEVQIYTEGKDEEAIRNFIQEKNIFTIPDWVQLYRFVNIPAHLIPITMGVRDDLTSETRLDEDGVRYITESSPNMDFFSLATAKDTRPLILHEGVPGHYLQLVLSRTNPDPVRRKFFDSGANEGIAFYVEELLLQYGLFDDSPKTREIIYSFMRLRALRVDVDINLAIGNFTIKDAGNYLASTVPMDLQTGIQEAGFFAYNPGQAISYQIGKLQILNLIAEAKVLLGEDFDLRKFHDYMLQTETFL